MAQQVTATDDFSIAQGARVVVRNSSGIPYVVTENTTDSSIDVWKGNSTTPTSFTEQDVSNNPDAASGSYLAASAAIDSSDVIHIAYWNSDGKDSALRYVQFRADGTNDDFQNDAQAVADVGGANIVNHYTAIAIDSSDIPHVAYVDSDSNMGSDFDTVYYNNRIGGSWNASSTEIEGATAGNGQNCRYPDIAVDADDKPCIVYLDTTGTNSRAAQGNANNATSFDLFTVNSNSVSGSVAAPSMAVDSSGNHHVVTYGSSEATVDLTIREHQYGDTWTTTWQTEEIIDDYSSTSESYYYPTLVIDSTDRYVFVEQFSSNDIYYYTDSGGSWTGPTLLETGTYNTVKAKWGLAVDNDSTGSIKTLNSYFFDGSDVAVTDPDGVWTNETNLDDSDKSTSASSGTAGSTASNYAKIEGTEAPTSGGTITTVTAGFGADLNTTGAAEIKIYTDGGVSSGELLGTITADDSGTVYTEYTGKLTAPSGGWTWAKIQALEVYIYNTDGVGTPQVYDAWVNVYTDEGATELDYVFQDEADPDQIHFNSLSLGGEPPAEGKIEWPTFMKDGFMNPRIGLG